jgi:hypothetical protein
LLVYADDVNLLGIEKDTTKITTETQRTIYYFFVTRIQGHHDMKITAKRPFENVGQFKCLGTTEMN